jgi:imidazolonepropionase
MRNPGLLEDASVLVREGGIVAAGPALEVESLEEARTAHEIDARGCGAMPGFVDSHTHLLFGQPRLAGHEMRLAGATCHDIAEAGGGLLASVRTVREMPREALAQHGTTTVETKSGYGLDRDKIGRAHV